MKPGKILGAASVAAICAAGVSSAQTVTDFTDRLIAIETNDCPAGTCALFSSMSEEDALSAFTALEGERLAASQAIANANASSAAASSSGNKKGRGNALGQQNNSPQVVYLAFGSDDPTFQGFNAPGVPILSGTFDDYIYSQEDRDFIQERLEADYAAYNYEFTQTEPTEGDYSVLRIGDNDANPIIFSQGILFGRADNIDFGNDGRNDTAFVDASFWQLLAEIDRIAGTQNLANFLGLPFALDAAGIEQFRQLAVVNQSANTASHELGHIQGLRHHDSIGAPGTGLPTAIAPGDFLPVSETDQDAIETLQHVMASGASVGLALNSPPFIDRFFSERSAVKLAINGRTRVIAESAAAVTGGDLGLKKVVGANPVLEGENSGGKLDIRAVLVEGSISEEDEADTYQFKAKAGEVFNAELISWTDLNVADPIIGEITLSLQQADGTFAPIGENRLSFEGLDPLLIDFELPESGTYQIEVTAPALLDTGGGGFLDLSALGFAGYTTGDYELLAYTVDGKPGNGPGKVPGPKKK